MGELTDDDRSLMEVYRRAEAAEEEVDRLREEIVRLQKIIDGFAARIAAQSELLSKRAQKS